MTTGPDPERDDADRAKGPTPAPPTPADDASVMTQLAAASTVGIEFVATVLLPGALGYWLDGRFGTRPLIMIGLGVFGFAVGLWRMLKTAGGKNGASRQR